jgi:V/A-type H+-transporting ATPase subunit I
VVVLVLGLSYGKQGIVGKIMGIFGGMYNGITGYFSDILSYSRLMALMLAGAVVAQVFNQLGAMTGNVITFVLIAMVGNALNFALNLLGCYVHDMRLQCLEFFGRFYEDGGKAFTPLDVNTKYVKIVKE